MKRSFTDPQFAGVVMDAITGDDHRRLAHWAIALTIAETLDGDCTQVEWSSKGVIELGVSYRDHLLKVKFSEANGEEVLVEVCGAITDDEGEDLIDTSVCQSVARGQIFKAVGEMCDEVVNRDRAMHFFELGGKCEPFSVAAPRGGAA